MSGRRSGAAAALAAATGAALLLVQSCTIRDVTGVPLASVTVVPGSAKVVAGQTQRFEAEVRDPEGTLLPVQEITWTSSDTAVARVASDGMGQALRPGTTEVRATVQGVAGTASMTVEPAPAIVLDTDTVRLFGQAGGTAPEPSAVRVTNGGAGTLSGLSASVTYAPGEVSGWLGLSLDGTSTPATLSLVPSSEGLTAGTYRASVSVASPGSASGPATLAVELVLTDDRPLLSLTPAAVGFAAVRGAAPPTPQSVQVTNAGGGELTGLAASVTYPGGAAGWLSAELAQAAGPTELTLAIDHEGLVPGSYEARVDVSSPPALNSPRSVPVTLTVEREPEADLSVTKSGPEGVTEGDTVSFLLTVANAGPRNAAETLLTDSLPTGFSVVSLSRNGVAVNGVASWALGTVAAGSTRTDTIRARAGRLGSFVNRARVNAATADPDPADNRDTHVGDVVPRPADLSVTKSGPEGMTEGDTVSFLLTVANAGPGNAAEALLTDSLPTGFSVVSLSRNGVAVNGVASWALGTVAAGSTRTDTIRARADRLGPFVNRARVDAATADPEPADNRDTHAGDVAPRPADLSVTKSGPEGVTEGDTVSFLLTVANAGPRDAAQALLTDSLPPGFSVVSLSRNGVAAEGVASWALGTVAAGSTRTDTIRARADRLGPFVNRVRVAAATFDSDPADNRDTHAGEVAPRPADLAVIKAGPADAVVGDTLAFGITVTNPGPGVARNVTTVDTLPEETAFLEATGGAESEGRVVQWGVDSLRVGETRVDTVWVEAVDTGTVTNRAWTRWDGPDPSADDNVSGVTTTVRDPAGLELVKSGPTSAHVTETIVYQLSLANTGQDTIHDITLRDSLPPEVAFRSASGGGQLDGSEVVWTRGHLAPGGSAEYKLRVTALVPGNPINVAVASTPTPAPDGTHLRTTFTTQVTLQQQDEVEAAIPGTADPRVAPVPWDRGGPGAAGPWPTDLRAGPGPTMVVARAATTAVSIPGGRARRPPPPGRSSSASWTPSLPFPTTSPATPSSTGATAPRTRPPSTTGWAASWRTTDRPEGAGRPAKVGDPETAEEAEAGGPASERRPDGPGTVRPGTVRPPWGWHRSSAGSSAPTPAPSSSPTPAPTPACRTWRPWPSGPPFPTPR